MVKNNNMVNVEMSIWDRMGEEKSQLVSLISDTYKSVNGIRPRGYDWEKFSITQLNAWLDNLHIMEEEVMEQDEIRELKAIAHHKRLINEVIQMGAGDYKTALRWMYGADEDPTHTLFMLGISQYTEYGAKIINDIN